MVIFCINAIEKKETNSKKKPDIITCWVWGPNGWLLKLGVMDYAGGTPVHISSGLAAVAYAMVLGKRRDYHENVNTPHNVSFVFLGLALMWFGNERVFFFFMNCIKIT